MAITHKVQAGDTVSAIAKRFNVPVSAVSGFRSNNANVIFPGEVLTVATPAEEAAGVTPQPVQTLDPTLNGPEQVQTLDPELTGPADGPVQPQAQPTPEPAPTALPTRTPAPVQTQPAPQQAPAPAPQTFTTPSGAVVDTEGRTISGPTQEPEEEGGTGTPTEEQEPDNVLDDLGFDQGAVERGFNTNPDATLSEIISQVMEATGLPDIRTNVTDLANEIESLENERDTQIEDIVDNPFISAGTQNARVKKLQEKFEKRINARVNRLTLLQDANREARQAAQFAATTAISLFDKDRRFQQDQLEFLLDQQEKSLEARRDLESTEFKRGLDLAKLDQGQQRLDLERFRAGQPNQSEIKRAIETNEKQAQARTSQVNTISVINDLLASPDLGTISGISRFGISARTAATGKVRSQLNQLKALTSLDGRDKLKGSGSISDFEAQMLSNSASSINFAIGTDGRVSLPDDEFKQELQNIRGVLISRTGQPVDVIATHPSTGESRLFSGITSDDLQEAALQGFVIDFQ